MTDSIGIIKKYAIGVDIGGTKILLIISDESGKEIHRKKVASTGDLYKIYKIINDFINESKLDKHNIVGMSIGVPGNVNCVDGIVRNSVQLGWEDVNIKKYMNTKFDFPIFIKNDVSFSALGERWIGNGQNSNNIVYISIGTGVGGAIIANGQLIEGFNYSAGEIAYIVDKNDIKEGNIITADEYGSFEKKVSGTALNKETQKIGITSKQLFNEYEKGNKDAVDIIDNFVKEISIAIANTVSLLNPEFVIIGGGVSESMQCIKDKISDYVKKTTPFKTEIRLSKLGGDAGAFGGIYYAFENFEK